MDVASLFEAIGRPGLRSSEEVMKILVFREKHGDRYFDASTDDERLLSAMRVFEERNKRGEYDRTDMARDRESSGTRRGGDALKMGPLYDKAIVGDMQAALDFIHLRSRLGYEYETFTVEFLEHGR